MNHRDLVKTARKKAKFHFLGLPEDLQDEVIEGLDSQKLTLEAASDLISERGFSLSHEAVAGYYRAVRRERRLHDMNQAVTRVMAEFAENPIEDNLKSLISMVIATAMLGLADGKVGIKNIDLSSLLKALPGATGTSVEQGRSDGDDLTVAAATGLTDDAADAIVQRILLGR